MAAADTGRARWLLGRLAAMGPAEIGLRAARAARDRLRRPSGPRPQGAVASAARALAEVDGAGVLRRLAEGRGTLLAGARDPAGLEKALGRLGVSLEGAAGAADQILAGSLRAFGWTTIDSGRPERWLRDPVTGLDWPLAYWSDVDFRSGRGLGDPRYVWEVNRCHHLVTLGRAYALTGKRACAQGVWESIASWIEANPPYFGINWASPLEVAIRLASWSLALDLTGGEGGTPALAREVARSVWLQAGHVYDNLSTYASSRNNHLIGETAGLYLTARKFPRLPGADAWARSGRRLLVRDLREQITPEGVPREQAFHYGVFVLEFCLAASAAGSGTGLPAALADRMAAMGRFQSAVAGTGGTPPAIGDGDGGRAYELSDAPGRQAQRAAAAAAVATGLPAPRGFVAADLAPAAWLFGPGAAVAWLSSAGAASPGTDSEAFPEGGYFVSRGGGRHCVIDCGPLGYRSIAAHGHADCLSVAICLGDDWVVPDPGTCCYHRDRSWRDHFRGTRAHSTVTVDGTSQSQMLGPFLWGRRARARAERWASHPAFDLFQGSHDGYARLGVEHRRTVVFVKSGYWVILDDLLGSGRHDVCIVLQFDRSGPSELVPGEPPGARGAQGPGRPAELRLGLSGGHAALVRSWLPEGVHAEVQAGSLDPARGWVSTGFGERHAAVALVAEGTVTLPVRAACAIAMGVQSSLADVGIRSLAPGGACFVASFPDGRDTVALGRVADDASGMDFSGVMGLRRERPDVRSSFGLGVIGWREAGREVEHQRVADLLAAPVLRKEHARA